LSLEEGSSATSKIVKGLFAVGDGGVGQGCIVRFAGQESLVGVHVLGEVVKKSFSGFCIRSWKLLQMALAEYFCSKEQIKLVFMAFQL